MQCVGETTTSQPPDGILAPKSLVGSLSTPVVCTVSIPPSHCHNIKSLILSATSSIRNTLQCSSRVSSGVPGPGYYSAKMINWLGETSINLVESAIIFKRCWTYQYELKRWKGYEGGAANQKREKLFFDMLGDLLELSRSALEWHLTHCLIVSTYRDCYSFRVKRRAFSLAERANLLILEPVSGPHKQDALTRRAFFMMCSIPM